MRASREEEERGARLRSRLWGAAVLIAALVIVLPPLLDGAGSENRFRRVERLREEPPRVIGVDGRAGSGTDQVIEPGTYALEPSQRESMPRRDTSEAATGDAEGAPMRIRIGEEDPPDYMRAPPSERTVRARQATAALSAWIVQAGSFGSEANALAVRDDLRRAGFASFVIAPEAGDALFRVRVGPMIDEAVARRTLSKVVQLTGLDARLARYP